MLFDSMTRIIAFSSIVNQVQAQTHTHAQTQRNKTELIKGI